MKQFNFAEFEKRHMVLACEDMPDRIRKVEVELRSTETLTASFVTSTGELVPIGVGPVIEYSGPVPEGFDSVDVVGPVKAHVAYRIQAFGPRRTFERLDPAGLVVVEQSPMSRPVKEALAEFLRSVSQTDLKELAEDIAEDAAETELDFEEYDSEFGEGYVEQRMEPEEKAPAERAPSPEQGAREASEDADNGKEKEDEGGVQATKGSEAASMAVAGEDTQRGEGNGGKVGDRSAG
jgi:hypothetical protein